MVLIDGNYRLGLTRDLLLPTDVVAYVDVWSSSKTENYSKPFIELLQEMGAEVRLEHAHTCVHTHTCTHTLAHTLPLLFSFLHIHASHAYSHKITLLV